MRVLHITNWYPSIKSPYTALWIQRHIEALQAYSENTVYHVEIVKGPLSISLGQIEMGGNKAYIASLPVQIWFFAEWIGYWLVRYIVNKEKGNFDIVNFHISYPLCTYLHKLKRRINTPIVITEHWSAYHYHFGIRGSSKLERIKNIFGNADKIITVSEALKQDIVDFCGRNDLDFSIVPNIVDTNVFYYEPRKITQLQFFMVSQWKHPKDPFTVIKAFNKLKRAHPGAVLRIGGYGPQEKDLKQLISDLRLKESIIYLGKLTSQQIAEEMRCANALVHLSDYETFSVVCAEAICCGCPIIASNVGGIKELVNDQNGVLLNTKAEGINIFEQFMEKEFDRLEISKQAHLHFSKTSIGRLYNQILLNVCQ